MAIRTYIERGVRYTFLTGFQWNQSQPTGEHIAWARTAAPQIAARGGFVIVAGAADSSRAPNRRGILRNQTLSLDRARAVMSMLQAGMGGSTVNFVTEGFSDSYARGRAPDGRWPEDRFVVVCQLVHPEPDWMITPRPVRNFYLRVFQTLSIGMSGSIGPLSASGAVVTWMVIISDGFWGQMYEFGGGSGTVGVSRDSIDWNLPSVQPELEGGTAGPWHAFQLRQARTVREFVYTSIRIVGVSGSAAQAQRSIESVTLEPFNVRFQDFDAGPSFGTGDIQQWISAGGIGIEASGRLLLAQQPRYRPQTSPGFQPSARCLELFAGGSRQCSN